MSEHLPFQIKETILPTEKGELVKGVITIETEGLPPHEIARLRRILHTVVERGILRVRSSFMTLHFSDRGELGKIEVLQIFRNLDQLNTPL